MAENAVKTNPFQVNTPDYPGQYANVPEFGAPNRAFSAPFKDAPYNDEFGWAPKPRISVENIPDAMRIQQFPVRTVRPGADQPPEEFYRPIDEDDKKRHSVEDQDANSWEIKKSQHKLGPDPRWNPPNETRITEKLSPRSYSFTRPFDQGSKGNGARTFNGVHMSMADHRRDYEILGMKPWAPHRNTYRIEPAPWDADLYDVPPESTIGTSVQGRIKAVDIPPSGNQAFRL